MNGREFEWDGVKANANRRKHGVSFDEAATIFVDPNLLVEFDDRHSELEDRWLAIGLSARLRLISATYTKRDEKIRLISARRATKAEEGRYVAAN